MDLFSLGSSLKPDEPGTVIEAIDRVDVAVYTLRGLSDLLVALSKESHDYEDAITVTSEIALHESQALKQVGAFLEEKITANSAIRNTE